MADRRERKDYDGPERRETDVHLEVLKTRLDRLHEDVRDLRAEIHEDLTILREEMERYVLRVELVPIKLVVFGGVGVILLAVLAAILLTVLKR